MSGREIPPKSNFDQIPNEILLKILKYVPSHDILHKVSKVSTRFRKIGPASITELDKVDVRTSVGKCPRLKRLDLSYPGCLEVAVRALKSCPMLRELIIYCEHKFPEELFQALRDHGSSLIRLAMYHFKTVGPIPLSRLKHLRIHNCLLRDEETLKVIGESCEGLETFSLYSWLFSERRKNHLPPPGLASLLRARRDSLREVEVFENLDDSCLQALVLCQNLKKLDLLVILTMTPEPGWTFLSSILKIASLTEIVLDKAILSHLTEAEVANAFEEGRLKNLEILRLYSCFSVSDLGLKAIGQGCPSLVRATFTGTTKVTDAGVDLLMEKCEKLRELWLVSCKNVTPAAERRIEEELSARLETDRRLIM